MKLRKLLRRMTAALVAGAMALSLCAPALAEGPGETADDTSQLPHLELNEQVLDLDGRGSYDAATHTFTLTALPDVGDASSILLEAMAGADGTSVNLVLDGITVSQRIIFDGDIDRLEFNGTAESDFVTYSDFGGSIDVNGTITGLVQLRARGDITVKGTLPCQTSYSHPQLILNSSEGNVTVESTGMPFPAGQDALLAAPRGSVSITGNVSGAMVSDALLVKSQSLQVTNNGGAVGSLYFIPAESGTYDFNGTPEDLLAGISEQYSTDGHTLAITPTGTDVLPTLSIYYDTGNSTDILIVATPNLLADANEDLKDACGESALAELAYDNATHTYTLALGEGFSNQLHIIGTASRGVVPSLTVTGDAGELSFDGEIDALTVNADVSGDLWTPQYRGEDPGIGSFTLNGTVSGESDIACMGDIRINGTPSGDDAYGWGDLTSVTGNIVINSPAAVLLTDLYAPEGGVWVTGSTDDPLTLLTEDSDIYAQKLVLRNNGTGGFPQIWFTPALDADYYINDTAPLPEPNEYDSCCIPASASPLLTIAPKGADIDLPSDDVDIATTGSGSAGSIGSAIAAAAIGGAAIWGGYEVATRVILHKLLPSGAAIPKTQAELAVLLWTTAGSPEPLNTPAFADVDETTAKAAQWCTEQGYLSRDFQPDKHVAKYNVIRAWNKAFPKAK